MYTLRNSRGVEKRVKDGISWTFFFFGAWVPLVRGDIKWFFLSIFLSFITGSIFYWILVFKYNDWYMNDLLNKGYNIVN